MATKKSPGATGMTLKEQAEKGQPVKGPARCTKQVRCFGLAKAIEETERFATARRGSALEWYASVSGASGVAYRTGGRPNSSLLAINFCPWCGKPDQVNSPAPKKRERRKG